MRTAFSGVVLRTSVQDEDPLDWTLAQSFTLLRPKRRPEGADN